MLQELEWEKNELLKESRQAMMEGWTSTPENRCCKASGHKDSANRIY